MQFLALFLLTIIFIPSNTSTMHSKHSASPSSSHTPASATQRSESPQQKFSAPRSQEEAIAFIKQKREEHAIAELEKEMQNLHLDETEIRKNIDASNERRMERLKLSAEEERKDFRRKAAERISAQKKIMNEEEQKRTELMVEEEQALEKFRFLLQYINELNQERKKFIEFQEASKIRERTLTEQAATATEKAYAAELQAEEALRMFQNMQKTHRTIELTAKAVWHIYDKAPKVLGVLGMAASITSEDHLTKLVGDSAKTVHQMAGYVGAMIATIDFLIKNHRRIQAKLSDIKTKMGQIKSNMEESCKELHSIASRFASKSGRIMKKFNTRFRKELCTLPGFSDSDDNSDSDDDDN